MWEAIAEGCHDELDLNLLRWTGTAVVADGDEAPGLAELGRRLSPGRRAAPWRGRAATAATSGGRGAGTRRAPRTRGPCPNTRRCASSWITTVSSASRGARTSRHDSDTRPSREALPQRLRGSRMVIARGATPRAAACSRDGLVDPLARARSRSHASMTAASGRAVALRTVDDESRRRTARRSDRGRRPRPGRRGSARPRPSSRIDPPSRAPPRAASSARTSACRARWRRSHGSRSAEELDGAPLAVGPRRTRVAGTVTTTPRSGWITTRRPRARGECRSVYGSGPPGSGATAGASVVGAAGAASAVRSSGSPQQPAGPLARLRAVHARPGAR